MKRIIATIALVAAPMMASAGTVVHVPTVLMGAQGYTGSYLVNVSDVCINGENLQTKLPHSVCTQWHQDRAGQSCAVWTAMTLSTPINQNVPVTERATTTEVTRPHALTYEIQHVSQDRGGNTTVHTESASIPGC